MVWPQGSFLFPLFKPQSYTYRSNHLQMFFKIRVLTAMVSCSRLIWVTNLTTGGFELRISCIGSSYLTHLWPYGLVGQVNTSYTRDSQFNPSCGHCNLWSKQVSSTTPSQFETWLEVEVSQRALKNFSISTKNGISLESLFNKVAGSGFFKTPTVATSLRIHIALACSYDVNPR